MSSTITSMDIPVEGEVHCKDGRSGTIKLVIVNPVTKRLTNLVVDYHDDQFIVPLSYVAATTPDLVVLNCTRRELAAMELFNARHFLSLTIPDYGFAGEYYAEPFVYPKSDTAVDVEERIPAGELAIRRTNEVQSKDGEIGAIDEFVISRETGDITHIVLRKGFAWAKHEIVIPVNAIDRIEDSEVYLKLNKKQVAHLPQVPIDRWWE